MRKAFILVIAPIALSLIVLICWIIGLDPIVKVGMYIVPLSCMTLAAAALKIARDHTEETGSIAITAISTLEIMIGGILACLIPYCINIGEIA